MMFIFVFWEISVCSGNLVIVVTRLRTKQTHQKRFWRLSCRYRAFIWLYKCPFNSFFRYTAHCLRATATQALDDAGCEIRHIMFMTGHRNEASVRSYSRGTTEEQKYKMSRILTNLSNGKEDSISSITKPVSENISPPMQELVPSHKPENQVAGTRDFPLRAGLFNPASCTFSNCTFSISHTN